MGEVIVSTGMINIGHWEVLKMSSSFTVLTLFSSAKLNLFLCVGHFRAFTRLISFALWLVLQEYRLLLGRLGGTVG